MSNDGSSSDTRNLIESPYQKRPSLGAEENDDKDTSFDDELVLRHEESNTPHRRTKSRTTFPKEQKPSYMRHLSFEGFFPKDDKYGVHDGSHFWFRRKAILSLALGVAFLVILLVLSWSGSSSIQPPGEIDGHNHHQDVLTDNTVDAEDTCTDPIKALEDSCTIENMQGAVASDMEVCSHVGTNILKYNGGNAVDAAVATALCLGVVNPASSGIGGGAMILIHSDMRMHQSNVEHEEYVSPPFHDARSDKHDDYSTPEKVTEFIDCREEAPMGATKNMFKSPEASSEVGGLAVAIPGELRGLELAHARHGRLSWSKVVEPAMVLARDGFEVSPYLAHEVKINTKKIQAFPDLLDLLSIVDEKRGHKRLVVEGDLLKLPKLANTLAAVMEGGADAMYTGERAKQISADIQKAGGIVEAQDLADYQPVLRSPLVARDIHGINLVGVGPPSSGGAAIIGAARFLSGYANPYAYMADTLTKHRLVEALKHVFAIRMSLSDPAFNTNTTLGAVSDMVEGLYMEELRRLSKDDGELPMSWYGGTKWAQLNDGEGQSDKEEAMDANEGDRKRLLRRFGNLHDHGTTHLSVVDKDRNAVAITSTVNTYFGSKVVSPSTGIIFNNQMDDFSTPGKPNYFGLHPSKANFIAPKKRPLSSMSPTMVFQCTNDSKNNKLGNLLLVLGASGGPKIISAVVQVLLNYAWLGMSLYESVASPRLHDQLLYHGKAVTTWEREPLVVHNVSVVTLRKTIQSLQSRGHALLPVTYMGTVQAVAVDMETNTLQAVSDIRKGGKPAGY